MQLHKTFPAVAVAFAALLGGCGSSGSSGSSSSTSSSAAPAASATASSSTSSGRYGAGTSSGAKAESVSLITTKHGKLGTILAYGPKKLTAYMFEADKGGTSACSGECAHAWPPVLGQGHVSGAAKSTALGTVKRSDGSIQVTYKGHPLYGFIKDEDHADSYGQDSHAFGAGWYVLTPSGAKVESGGARHKS